LILQYHSIEVGVQEEGRRKKKIIFPSAPLPPASVDIFNKSKMLIL
jgi:hypothetical protein